MSVVIKAVHSKFTSSNAVNSAPAWLLPLAVTEITALILLW